MLPLTALCCSDVATLVAVTVAPTIAAPELSCTVPEIYPVFTWALTVHEKTSPNTAKLNKYCIILLFTLPSLNLSPIHIPREEIRPISDRGPWFLG